MGKCVSVCRGHSASNSRCNSAAPGSRRVHTDSSGCEIELSPSGGGMPRHQGQHGHRAGQQAASGVVPGGKSNVGGRSRKRPRSPGDMPTAVTPESLLHQHNHSQVGGVDNSSRHHARRPRLSAAGVAAAPTPTEQLLQLFQKYSDLEDHELAITDDGVARLCDDLQLDHTDVRVLILAWKCDAITMCRFTRPQFVQGGLALGPATSIAELRLGLERAKAVTMTEPALFRQMYVWTFRFGLESGQKSLALETAVGLWRVVFSIKEPALLKRWLTFLGQEPPPTRGITRDTWDMFLNFVEAVGDDLTLYNDAEAWPTLIDDFVEYETDRANQNLMDSEIETSTNERHHL